MKLGTIITKMAVEKLQHIQDLTNTIMSKEDTNLHMHTI